MILLIADTHSFLDKERISWFLEEAEAVFLLGDVNTEDARWI